LHPSRLGALLEESGLIHDQDPARVAELLDDVGPYVVAERIGVPTGTGQQPLHPIWSHLAGVLGQLPAVLAFDPTKQAVQEPGSSAAHLRTDEPGADPLAQPLELGRQPSTTASTLCLHRSALPSGSEQPTPQKVRLQY
jgi:hypothetical protein